MGKSATGNILNRQVFHKEASSLSVTKSCMKATSTLQGCNLVVVDTPGWCDTNLSETEIVQETIECIDMSYPGPHVFLLVVSIGHFTKEESKAVQRIQEVFGEGATKYMMIVFTRGDDLEDKGINEYLANAKTEFKNLVDKCGRRYHVLSNREQNNRDQVHMLLMKIQDMVRGNGGNCYTNTTYHLLDIYRRKEAEIQKQIRSMEREMQIKEAEFQWKMAVMEQEQQQQKMRESKLKAQLMKSEVKRAHEQATLLSTLENLKMELVHKEERRKSAEKAQQILGSARAKTLAEEQQKHELEYAEHQRKMRAEEEKLQTEWKMHRLQMEEEELKRQIAESQHKQGMEEEREKLKQERRHMLREFTQKMDELHKQEQQTRKEKEEWLRRSIRKMSCCSIA